MEKHLPTNGTYIYQLWKLVRILHENPQFKKISTSDTKQHLIDMAYTLVKNDRFKILTLEDFSIITLAVRNCEYIPKTKERADNISKIPLEQPSESKAQNPSSPFIVGKTICIKVPHGDNYYGTITEVTPSFITLKNLSYFYSKSETTGTFKYIDRKEMNFHINQIIAWYYLKD